jgi:hypothetical protein
MRSPIYYDQNDTGYFGDFNGISSLWGIAIRGDNGPTSTTNQIFFWGGGNTTTSAIGFKNNGGSFPNPTGSGDGYNTYLTMDTPGRGWVFREGVGGTNFGAAYTSGWILNNGIWQANASMRAPIFYDSNNTAHYVDAAGTSVLNLLTIYGGNSYGATYFVSNLGGYSGSLSSPPLQAYSTGNNSAFMSFHKGGQYAVNMGLDADNVLRIGGWSAAANRWQLDMSGNVYVAGSSRAPVFYDLDNTGYYADLNSTGTSINIAGSVNAATYNKPGLLLNASGTSSSGAAFGMQQVTGEGWTGIFVDFEPYTGWGLYHDNPNNYFLFTSEATTGQIGSGFTVPSRVSGNRTAYTKFLVDQATGDIIAGRIATAQQDMRAPIFYDRNDTSYYIDAASSSYLNNLFIAGTIRNNGSVADDDAFGIYWDSAASAAYAIYREPGSWTYPYPDLRIAFHTGIKIGANASYQGVRFYDDYTMVTEVMSVNNGSSPIGASHVYVNNILQAGASLRAPIFYDSGNTAYYLDAGGASYLASSLEIANGYVLTNGVGGAIWMSSAQGSFGGYMRFGQHAVFESINGGYHFYVLDASGIGVVKYSGNQYWSAYSDGRIKTIHSIMQNNLSKLDGINPIYYSFNNFDDDKNRIGLIAQEVQQHFPELVDTDPKTDNLTLDYIGLIPVLLGAIKELKTEVETLKTKI